MSKVVRATPYTPVFPPSLASLPLPISPDSANSASTSYESSSDELNKRTTKSYVDRLKERYILLASLPEELCPPSREASPEAEIRIEALRLRMRKARIPQLTLACVGVRGGDWVGEPTSDDENGEREYVLPATEEEWFTWEKMKKMAREKRRAERKAAADRKNIAKWTEAIEAHTSVQYEEAVEPSQERLRVDGGGSLGFLVVKRAGVVHTKDKGITSRYFTSRSPPSHETHSEQSDPVERASSPIPPAPVLDPLPNFFDSFSMPNSPPSLPQDLPNPLVPSDIPPTLSFALKDTHISTPLKVDRLPEPAHQLSSPVSPPRSLRPLTASHTQPSMSSKRPREGDQSVEDASGEDVQPEPSTPRAVKKARTMMEPITPTSVMRPSASQEQAQPPDTKRLPTLTALLRASSKKSSPRARPKPSPSPSPSPSPIRHHDRTSQASAMDFSPSQPTYAMFRPQFQSTQRHGWSLPPSPSQPEISTQPLSPQKAFAGTASSGIGFYQSQFNVERRVDEVAAFMNADVWDIEA